VDTFPTCIQEATLLLSIMIGSGTIQLLTNEHTEDGLKQLLLFTQTPDRPVALRGQDSSGNKVVVCVLPKHVLGFVCQANPPQASGLSVPSLVAVPKGRRH
jgi:hypothetical protein